MDSLKYQDRFFQSTFSSKDTFFLGQSCLLLNSHCALHPLPDSCFFLSQTYVFHLTGEEGASLQSVQACLSRWLLYYSHLCCTTASWSFSLLIHNDSYFEPKSSGAECNWALTDGPGAWALFPGSVQLSPCTPGGHLCSWTLQEMAPSPTTRPLHPHRLLKGDLFQFSMQTAWCQPIV